MDERQRAEIVRRAQRVSNLSSNDVLELKNIMRSGLKPFAEDLQRLTSRAARDDDAVLLKAALQGESSLTANERYRLNEAIIKRGRRIPG
jgi:hypothetical protein